MVWQTNILINYQQYHGKKSTRACQPSEAQYSQMIKRKVAKKSNNDIKNASNEKVKIVKKLNNCKNMQKNLKVKPSWCTNSH